MAAADSAASSWKQARPHSCLEKEGREGEGVLGILEVAHYSLHADILY